MRSEHATEHSGWDGLTRAQFLRAGAGAATALALGGSLAACGSTTHPDTIRLGGGAYGYPNPYGYIRGPGYWLTSFTFDSLIWKDRTGSYIPWLATKWDTPDHGLTWRFGLRDGITWQDGAAFSAADVAFTFRYMVENPPPPTVPFRLQFVKGATALDPRTVEIRLAKPYAGFLARIAASQPIIPQHIWSHVSSPAAFRGNEAVIGTGAYRLESYSSAQGTYLYTANDRFFLGKPYIRRIENPNVGDQLLALRRGDIDAGGPNLGQPAGSALNYFRNNSGYGVIEGPPDFTLALYFNMARGGPLADARFRRAVARAVNRQDVVARLLQGQGLPGNPGWLPPSSAWYTPVETYPFDLAKARAELDAAGYREIGGVRHAPDGTPLRLALSFSPAIGAQAAELLSSYLKPLGITLDPRPFDQATLDQITTTGRYELALVNYGGLGGDPDYMRVVFLAPAPQFQVVHGYDNPQFKKLATEQAFTPNAAARRALLDRCQQILAADVPVLPLYYPYFYEVFRKDAFDAWYFTPGGFGGGVPTVYNKQVLITGRQTGAAIKPRT